MGLSSSNIRTIREEIQKRRVPPHYVKTQEEADRMNSSDKLLGIDSNWKVGDAYYCIYTESGMEYA